MNKEEQPGPKTPADTTGTERDRLKQRVKRLEASLALARSRLERTNGRTRTRQLNPSAGHNFSQLLKQATMTAAGFVLLGTATGFTVSRDSHSAANGPMQAVATTSVTDTSTGPVAAERASPSPSAGEELKLTTKEQTSTGKNKIRLTATSQRQHRQWGPALIMQQTPANPRHYAFDPLLQQLQKNLLALGFDIGKADGFGGPRTRQAVEEFRSLYLSGSGLKQEPDTQELATIAGSYAVLAQIDANTFDIDRGVVAAIRLSSVRTGVEFPYLMELAAAESNFRPVSQASSSSASGLYQFTRGTWLNTLKKHGAQYGLERYTSQIEYYIDGNGNQRPMVKDDAVRQHLLALRRNPRVSAMMAAETVKHNQQLLSYSLKREPARTDLYLMHFLGNAGAISFLKALDKDPGVEAVKLFPTAAKSNKNIFHPRTCGPRTLSDVYELFEEKFNTSLYDGG